MKFFLWISAIVLATPTSESMVKSELIHWELAPSQIVDEAQKFSSRSKVTSDGKILLISKRGLFTYSLDAKFINHIEVNEDQVIRCAAYEPQTQLYLVNVFTMPPKNDDEKSYFRFYKVNGTEISAVVQEDFRFEYDEQEVIVNQITHYRDNIFILNIWHKSFNSLGVPKTLVFATLEKNISGYQLVARGKAFDVQTDAKSQYKNNFLDRWVVFPEGKEMGANNGFSCLVSHEMSQDFELYDGDPSFLKNPENFSPAIERMGTAYGLEDERWKTEKAYVTEIRRKADAVDPDMSEEQFYDFWFYHFSRTSGLYKLDNYGEFVWGFISPNLKNRYYKKEKNIYSEEKNEPFFTLTLNHIFYDSNNHTIHPKETNRFVEITGGKFLGTFKNRAYVLKEEISQTQNKNLNYSLWSISF